MLKTVIGKGKSIEEALSSALSELKTTSENVDMKVLEVPSGGFMGLGAKGFKVEVTLKEKASESASEFLKELLSLMAIEAVVDVKENDDIINLNLTSDDVRVLVGKHGQTLDAIQYIIGLVTNKNKEDYKRIIVDVNDYREKRRKTLETLASRIAKKVMKIKKDVELEPMNPYERRIIHAYLQAYPNIKTHSEGEGNERHLIISYDE